MEQEVLPMQTYSILQIMDNAQQNYVVIHDSTKFISDY